MAVKLSFSRYCALIDVLINQTTVVQQPASVLHLPMYLCVAGGLAASLGVLLTAVCWKGGVLENNEDDRPEVVLPPT